MYLHYMENIQQQIYSSESADLCHGKSNADLEDHDDFQNLTETFLCKDVSPVKFS